MENIDLSLIFLLAAAAFSFWHEIVVVSEKK
jgi:hypothetical protein